MYYVTMGRCWHNFVCSNKKTMKVRETMYKSNLNAEERFGVPLTFSEILEAK